MDEHRRQDRGFEAAQRNKGAEVSWEPSNPNVLTVAKRGFFLEQKVTKRSMEQPGPGALGSSEYSRASHSFPNLQGGRAPTIVLGDLGRRLKSGQRAANTCSTVSGAVALEPARGEMSCLLW